MTKDYRVFDKMLEGVQVINKNWQFIYLNDAVVNQAKLDRANLMSGRTVMELYPGVEKTELFTVLKSIMDTGVSKNITTRFDYPDRSFGYFDLYMEPVEEGIMIFSFDITEKKLYEKKLLETNQTLEKQTKIMLKQSEALNNSLREKNELITRMQEEREFVETLFQYSTEGLLLVDNQGDIIRVNSNAEKMFGYAKNELTGQKMEILIPEYLKHKYNYYKETCNKKPIAESAKSAINLSAKRKDGSGFPVEIGVSPYRKNNESFVIIFVVDVTVRKKKEAELKESEQRFRLLVESVEDYAIFMIDVNGNVVSWNEGAKKLKGYSSEEIVGKNISMFYPPEDIEKQAPAYHLKQAKEKGHFKSEGVRVKKDGSRFIANVVYTTLYNENKKHTGFAKITNDITERKKREEELQKNNQLLEKQAKMLIEQTESLNKSLDEKIALIKEIHHRVKNNLQMIISLIHLQSNHVQDALRKNVFQSIEDKINTLAMVHNMLYAEDNLLKIDLGNFIETLCHYILARYEKPEAHLDIDVNLNQKEVNIDTAISFGLLLNEIFTNAVKHGCPSKNSCRVYVSLRNDEKENFLLKIGDTGKGMPKKIMEKEDSFLGLSMIDDMVGQLDGTCQRISDDKGTRYDITFKEIHKVSKKKMLV